MRKGNEFWMNVRMSRHGVTLVEVLVSLMIMGIGVVLVMSLFPVSALRTLKATQLTNAAILAHNVDALITQDPAIIFDPDNDGDLDEHIRLPVQRNYVIDPLGYYTFQRDGTTDETVFGNDGTGVPVPAFGMRRFGGGLDKRFGTTVVDLLALAAQEFAGQPDGWVTDIETFATDVVYDGTDIVGVELGELTAGDVGGLGTSKTLNEVYPFAGTVPDPEQYRIVVFDSDDRFSQAFPLLHVDTATTVRAVWSEPFVAALVGTAYDFNNNGRDDIRPLPVEFNGQVGRVLLQSRRGVRFTWMLSVRRRSDGDARSVDVVVRYQNGVDYADEELFPANFGGGTNVIGVLDNGARAPRLKRGGFVFDPIHAVWYRITGVQQRPPGSGGTGFWALYKYRLTVDSVIRQLEGTGADFENDGILNGDDSTSFGRAIFPNGVVEVYPLGPRRFPDFLR